MDAPKLNILHAARGRSLVLLICLSALCPVVTHGGIELHPTRQQVIGAWRLLGIDYGGVQGALSDPFYQADSTGIIIYDASGWMSVHISAPHRSAWPIPESRLPRADGASEASLKADAFDTYYTYCGTWTLDEQTGTVTHHVRSSLMPGEIGVDYRQQISLEGGHLVFTTHTGHGADEITRKKRWERIAPSN